MPTRFPTIEACDSPATRKLLLAYGTNRASKREHESFEQHVRSCPRCSDDLAAMWRAAELIDEWTRRPDDAPAGIAGLVRAHRRRRVVLSVLALAAAAACGYLLKTAL